MAQNRQPLPCRYLKALTRIGSHCWTGTHWYGPDYYAIVGLVELAVRSIFFYRLCSRNDDGYIIKIGILILCIFITYLIKVIGSQDYLLRVSLFIHSHRSAQFLVVHSCPGLSELFVGLMFPNDFL